MIWDFQDALTRRLLLWSVVSMVIGAALLVFGDPFWRGFGLQAVVWGGVDAAIAFFGRRTSNTRLLKHVAAGGNPASLVEREAKNLRRLLWINTGLDVLYVVGGAALVITLGQSDLFARGNGWGIIVQGGFLFLFDLLHALAVPRQAAGLPPWNAFTGAEHQPFSLQGGKPAALLLHGFLGTPAEMRGLAAALHEQGWTVSAPLLPGFGCEIDTLTSRRWHEWAAAVDRAIDALQDAGHTPLLLVGYSMGASLSLVAANRPGVRGLALLAPFAWPEPRWLPPVEFAVRPFLPLGFRPLRKADFANPQLRQGIGNFMPDLNLDDPEVQAAVRGFRVPLGLIDQVRGFSRAGLEAAPKEQVPVLVVQGKRDQVARSSHTGRLIAKLPRKPAYVEVDSDHNLTDINNPAFGQVRQAVLDFAATIAAHAG